MTQPPNDQPDDQAAEQPDEPLGGSLTPEPMETPDETPEAGPAAPPPPPPAAPADSGFPPPPPPAESGFPPPPPPAESGYQGHPPGYGNYPPPPAPGAYPPPAPAYPPAFPPGPGAPYGPSGLKRARGGLILGLAIAGLLCCFPLSFFAFFMGRNDLAAIDSGQMDPSGRGTTNIGRILGLVGIIWLVLQVVWVALNWGSITADL
jgi:hypothetical protein